MLRKTLDRVQELQVAAASRMSREQKILYSSLGGLAGILALLTAASGDWAGAAVNAGILLILTAWALLAIFENQLGNAALRAAILVLFLSVTVTLIIFEEGDWYKVGRFVGIILLIALFQIGFGWARDRQRGHRKVLENRDD